jgi:hypothetical protein
MRNISIGFILLFGLLLFSCKPSNQKTSTTPDAMTSFLKLFNGTASQVAVALEKYGATTEIVKNDMSLYDLNSPKILKQNGDCYLVEFDIAIAAKIYEICWESDKIIKINDIGLK